MTGYQGWSRSCLTSDWMSRTVREMWLPRQDKIGNNFLVNCLIKAIAYATGTNYLYYCSAINPPWQANLYLYFFKYCTVGAEYNHRSFYPVQIFFLLILRPWCLKRIHTSSVGKARRTLLEKFCRILLYIIWLMTLLQSSLKIKGNGRK